MSTATTTQVWTTADWAFVVSLFSATLALAGFIWNVWSKFIYPKPKVAVWFAVMNLVERGELAEPHIQLTAINHGPGAVWLQMVVARERRWWKTLLRMPQDMGILNPLHGFPAVRDHTVGPYSGGLPAKLEVGETFSSYQGFRHEGLRDSRVDEVGFVDTFGRYHWAPRSDVRKVIGRIRDGFPKEGPNASPGKDAGAGH